LNQYNWMSVDEIEAYAPSDYQSTFKNFFTNNYYKDFWHYTAADSEKTYLNVTNIFCCNWDTAKIHDKHTNNVPYGPLDVNIAYMYDGGVYSVQGAGSLTDELFKAQEYVAERFNPVALEFVFDNTINEDPDDANSDTDAYCVYENGTLSIGTVETVKTIDLSGVDVRNNGISTEYEVFLNGEKVTGTVIELSAEVPSQVLTFKAVDEIGGYTAEGTPRGEAKEYIWTVPVQIATLAYPAPEWNMGGNYTFDTTNCVYAYYTSSQGYAEAVPIYEGVKVVYYDKGGNKVEKDFSGTTALPSGTDTNNTTAFSYTLGDGSVLTMKFVKGWKAEAGTHLYTAYKNKVYAYPAALDTDAAVRAKVTKQNFDVQIAYTFTDPNGQSTETKTIRWYNAAANNGSVTTVQWKTFDSTNGKKATTCVTADTLITLANGNQKRIDEMAYDEKILVWNFYTGTYDVAHVAALVNHGADNYEVTKLQFSDGSQLKFIGVHGAFSVERNAFVDITAENADTFVGESFLKQEGEGFVTVTLMGTEIVNEQTESWTIVSAKHYNAILNGVLTANPSVCEAFPEGGVPRLEPYEAFELGEGMKFDVEKMQADIEKYGLYTYEDFEGHISYQKFEDWNLAPMKVVVGKGYSTFEDILRYIDIIRQFTPNE